jgi:hypothetical protein
MHYEEKQKQQYIKSTLQIIFFFFAEECSGKQTG